MSDQAGILPKWFSNRGIILAKGQLDHSYTFWTMANYTYDTSTKFADSHVTLIHSWYKWMQISQSFYSIVYNILIHWIVFQYLLWVQGKTFMHFFDTCRQVRFFRRSIYKEIPYLLVLDNFLIILCLFKSTLKI